MRDLPFSKAIDVADFNQPALVPYLREINALEAGRYGAVDEAPPADAYLWRRAMALRALDAQDRAAAGQVVAAIGAGTEPTLFALARRGAVVFAIDRYLLRSVWTDQAPGGMMIDPSRYSSLEFPRGNVIAIHSSATRINLPDDFCDAVISAGSIGHLGSLDSVAIAARELARILKPGGVAAISADLLIDGPPGQAGFDDQVILFTPGSIRSRIVEASGLELRESIEFGQSEGTFASRLLVNDFLKRPEVINTLEEKRATCPNVLIYHEGFLFSSFTLTLHKSLEAGGTRGPSSSADSASDAADDRRAAAEIEAYQRSAAHPIAAATAQIGAVDHLQAEIERLNLLYARATSWKRWRILRPARLIYRILRRRSS